MKTGLKIVSVLMLILGVFTLATGVLDIVMLSNTGSDGVAVKALMGLDFILFVRPAGRDRRPAGPAGGERLRQGHGRHRVRPAGSAGRTGHGGHGGQRPEHLRLCAPGDLLHLRHRGEGEPLSGHVREERIL